MPSPGRARLDGSFLLAGVVTDAKLIPGEKVGQRVTRTWTFTSRCPTGACSQVQLARPRPSGTDRLTLRRKSPANYTGTGTFYAPARCGSKTFARGTRVPFTITVKVTSARLIGGVVTATRVNTTYLNRSRTNLTPCVAVVGHDAATYHGHLVIPPAPSGGTGPGP